MIGWLIVLVISILVTVVFMKLKAAHGHYSNYEIGIVVFGAISLIFAVVTLLYPFVIKEEVNTFKRYQGLVEASYSEEEMELNYAINIQVIELNVWLAKARAMEETYGIFSFYSGKLDDLEYIEIGDE